MHVEKNVRDSLIEILLNFQGKTNYGKNARLDLLEVSIRQELAPKEIGKKHIYP